jgi:hypothetical protein
MSHLFSSSRLLHVNIDTVVLLLVRPTTPSLPYKYVIYLILLMGKVADPSPFADDNREDSFDNDDDSLNQRIKQRSQQQPNRIATCISNLKDGCYSFFACLLCLDTDIVCRDCVGVGCGGTAETC